jgi:molybdopterin synthase catalytic subunit
MTTTGQQGSRAEVVLCALSDEPLSLDAAVRAVRHPDCGGVALFLGHVRQHDHGEQVTTLDYSAHPGAVAAMEEVCQVVASRAEGDGPLRIAVAHRTGHLEVGDTAVVVAVAAPHRGAALSACRDLIDTLKTSVPIWKHQLFADGRDEWVGLP